MRFFFFIFVLSTFYQLLCSAHGKERSYSVIEVADDDDNFVQLNPDYELQNTDDYHGHDNSDDDDDENDDFEGEGDDSDGDVDGEEEHRYEKKKVVYRRRRSIGKWTVKTVRSVKKNKLKITVAIALFAFRNEIAQFLIYLLGTKHIDENGKVIGRKIRFNPTALMKVLIFLDVMRKIQSNDSTAAAGIPALFSGNPFLSALMAPHDSSYIPPIVQHYTFERINERYNKDGMALRKALGPSPKVQNSNSAEKISSPLDFQKNAFTASEQTPSYNGTVILMDLTRLGTTLSNSREISDKVSFLLHEHRNKRMTSTTNTLNTTNATIDDDVELEIVILIESPGGSAADYGLAAQQILRLRDEPGVVVTVCVDKVAASGGYMMACTSSPGRLFAAPFAVVGSIGVIGQAINIHELLQNKGVKPLVFRGGKDKAPVGLLGEVTSEAVDKVQRMVDKTHSAFKRHVLAARPQIAAHIENVATGDIWLGCDAVDVGLIDRCLTSDEYISQRLQDGSRVLRIIDYSKPRLFGRTPSYQRRLASSGTSTISQFWTKCSNLIRNLSKLADVAEGQLLDKAIARSCVSDVQVDAKFSPAQ